MKVIISFVKYFALIFLLTGLTVIFATNKKRGPTSLKKEKSNNLEVDFKKADDTGVKEKDKKEIISANNKFALDLYSYLSSENPNQNIFFSPYGVFTAMAMTYEGASGQTAKEIQSVFYFPENNDIRRPAIANIYNQLNKPRTEYKLLTANALWLQGNLQSRIFKEIQKYYGAEIFLNTPVEIINQWIEHKTMNKFSNVIEDCSPIECALSLINIIYFKGDWRQKFEKSKTKEMPFIISDKEEIKVPMMNTEEIFYYTETKTMQMLEMLYEGEELSMLILLPKDFPGKPKTNTKKNLERANLISLEKKLTEKNLNEWKKDLFNEKVKVSMPKFTFKKRYKLEKTLPQYMPSAFDAEKADFSKFSKNIPLHISEIIHESFIDVNEEGTEAAAVTVVHMTKGAMRPPPPVFKANHPFLFLIQEQETGQILFMGRVVNPIQSED